MMEFIQDNWLVLLSLAIALVGGVPGVLAVVSHVRDKPIFHYSSANVVIGELAPDEESQPRGMILLSGTVANAGNQPLSPDRFELEVEFDSQWKQFEPMLIPEGVQFHSSIQEIQITEPWTRDLQRFSGAIGKGTPLHGCLMFASREVPLDELQNLISGGVSARLSCVDIYGRKRIAEVEIGGHSIGPSVQYPKHGLSIRAKA